MQIDLAAVKQISIDMMLKSARSQERNSDFLVLAGRFIVRKLKETQLPMSEFKPLLESAYTNLPRSSHKALTIQEYFNSVENELKYTMKNMGQNLESFDETINILLDENLESSGISDEWLYNYPSKVQDLTKLTWSLYENGFLVETVNEEGQVTKQRCYGVSLNKEHLLNCNILKKLNNLHLETFEKNMKHELRNIVYNIQSAIAFDHPKTPDKLLHGLFAAHCFSTLWSEMMCDNTSVFQSDIKKIFEDVLTESVYAEAYKIVGRPVLKALSTVKASATLPENIFDEMMATEKDWISTTTQLFDPKNAPSNGLNEFITQLKSVQKEVEQRIRVLGQTHPLGEMEDNLIDLSNKQIGEIVNAVEVISALQNKNGFITAKMENLNFAEELKNRVKIARKMREEKELLKNIIDENEERNHATPASLVQALLSESVEHKNNVTERMLSMREIAKEKYTGETPPFRSIPDDKNNAKFGKIRFKI